MIHRHMKQHPHQEQQQQFLKHANPESVSATITKAATGRASHHHYISGSSTSTTAARPPCVCWEVQKVTLTFVPASAATFSSDQAELGRLAIYINIILATRSNVEVMAGNYKQPCSDIMARRDVVVCTRGILWFRKIMQIKLLRSYRVGRVWVLVSVWCEQDACALLPFYLAPW